MLVQREEKSAMDEKHGQMLDILRVVQVYLMVVLHVSAMQGDVPPPRPVLEKVRYDEQTPGDKLTCSASQGWDMATWEKSRGGNKCTYRKSL